MLRLFRFSAPFLLAVLTAGGVVMPTLHRIAHVEAAQREAVAHGAYEVGTHSHDEAHAGHGVELTTPCPPRLAPELDCAICAGLSAHVVTAAPVLAPPVAVERVVFPESPRLRPTLAVETAVRGPPVG
ncbi:MAG TPA: DUF2946 family protein [Rhodothermales bacterium]|nr:DUF2946 family protein [Rhodothermales bacterium]